MMKAILTVLIATSMIVAITTQTQTQDVNASSVIGSYADGYEDGKDQGVDDRLEGRNHDSKCPPNDSIAYCTGYKVGYEVGWIATGAIQ
jgi:hypothetical protein